MSQKPPPPPPPNKNLLQPSPPQQGGGGGRGGRQPTAGQPTAGQPTAGVKPIQGGIVGLIATLMGNKKDKSEAHRKSVFSNIFGTAMLANRWKAAISEERQARIIELFSVSRDEKFDVYKPNSKVEMQATIEKPYDKPLREETAEMLQEVAAHYDYCCNLDVTEATQPQAFISFESQEQLDRLPTWLRFLVICKYDLIHERYGHHTHNFLKLLANKVDMRRLSSQEQFEPVNDDDFNDEYEITSRYEVTEKDISEATKSATRPARFSATPGKKPLEMDEDEKRKMELETLDLFKIRKAVAKWRLPRSLEQDWAPNGIHRAAVALRRALLTQPAAAEVAMVAEDERIRKNESAITKYDNEEEDENASSANKIRKPSWEDMVADKAGFREQVAIFVEEDLRHIPKGLSKEEREEELRLAREVAKKTNRKTPEEKHFWRKMNNQLFKKKKEKKERKVSLQDRSTFRKYSRIWHKNCPQEPTKQAKRLPHHYRCDESFHMYVVTLVGSKLFKNFIMFVIIANAILLALETGENKEDPTVAYTFDVLDEMFLSVYLVEFMLKVYAQPYRYWMSGFNVFDAIILSVSLVKTVVDWIGLSNLSFLKVLVIVRALRILRGISMSIQIQVLITALVETLKTHVLSVLILLFLLMYIASIFAFYFFKDIEGAPWGNILAGMLRLFSFVTMDGWTDTSEEFDRAGKTEEGRIFCLMCILLGNFLISNIFIAIIIMQISEATEAFRSRQRDEREEIITLKKEIVFRRQKLDMRQLLAKQNMTSNADFYYLGSQFLKLLRHDDLVDMNDVPFSPLWMDAFFKTIHRCHHTANLLMNLHRQHADNLLAMYELNNKNCYTVTPIRRSRYNRYMKLKSKLSILRQEFYRDNPGPGSKLKGQLKLKMTFPPPPPKTAKRASQSKEAAPKTATTGTGQYLGVGAAGGGGSGVTPTPTLTPTSTETERERRASRDSSR